jgi:predicted ATP-binding protein involved in virulence
MATENPKITHIERVEIKGLWGKYDIDWTLNRDVNILVGINGSGKSTVLFLIEKMFLGFSAFYNDDFKMVFDNLKILLNDHNIIVGECFEENAEDKDILTNIFSEELNHGVINKPYVSNYSMVSTFEINHKPLEAIQALSNNNVKTTLDWEIHNSIISYKGFKSEILTRVIETDDKSILDKDKKFQEIVNQAFSKTEKKILINRKSDINFLLGDKTLSPYELSSGEKQLLIILLKVLIQDNQPYILLMDEPEVSLHLEWQFQLIDNIRALNPNCQIILATHSPAIFGKGKGYKITNMEDIREELKPVMNDAE